MLPVMEARSIRGRRTIARGGMAGPALGAAALVVVLVVGYAAATRAGVDVTTLLLVLAAGLPAVALSGFAAARRPVWIVAAVAFLMAFSGSLAGNYDANVTPAVWLLLLGLLAATFAGYLNAGRAGTLVVWPGIAALGGYLVFSVVQIPFAETTEIGARAFVAGPALMVAFFALAYARWSPATRWRIAQAFVLVAVAAGLYAMFRLAVGPSAGERSLVQLSADVAGDPSLFGSFPNRLQLGAWSAIAIPFLLSVALGARGRWRALAIAATALMIVALLGSEVRTALLGAGLGIVVAGLFLQATRSLKGEAPKAFIAIAALAVAGMIGFGLTVGSDRESSERFSRILSPGQDYSFQARVEKWNVALEEINDNPIGQGLGTAGTTQRQYSKTYRLDNKYIDNSYLQLGIQQGYPGWILLGLGLGLIGYMIARSSLATSDPRLAAIGCGAVASLVTWAVVLLTGDMLTSWAALLMWMLLGLAAGGFVAPSARRGGRVVEKRRPLRSADR